MDKVNDLIDNQDLLSDETMEQLKEYYQSLPTHSQAMIMAYLLGVEHGKEQGTY